MATTIIVADAVVTLSVSLTLAGKPYDIEFSKTISDVTRADRNIVPVPFETEVSVVQLFAAAIEKGTFTDFNGFFIMNRDDTNAIRLRFARSGGDTVDIQLNPGDFFVLYNNQLSVNTTEAAFVGFVDMETISMQAVTAEVDVEYLAIQI